jgi:hypothetical protein
VKRNHIQVIAILTIMIIMGYVFRWQAAAAYWHLMHGSKLSVGNYILLIPREWYEMVDGILISSGTKDTIVFSPIARSSDLQGWAEIIKSNRQKGGLSVAMRQFSVGGERVLCVESTSSVDCRFERNLLLTYSGSSQRFNEFYGFVSRIENVTRREDRP